MRFSHHRPNARSFGATTRYFSAFSHGHQRYYVSAWRPGWFFATGHIEQNGICWAFAHMEEFST